MAFGLRDLADFGGEGRLCHLCGGGGADKRKLLMSG